MGQYDSCGLLVADRLSAPVLSSCVPLLHVLLLSYRVVDFGVGLLRVALLVGLDPI